MLSDYRERYARELLESVVPFWRRHSIDLEYGGFFSCLDREGRVYDDRKYIWLQGRAVWTFSRLYREIEPRAEWLDAARRGAEFLEKHAFNSSGRCYFSLTRQGAPLSFRRKPFAAVFVVLGFLEYGRASGDRYYQHMAEELFWRIESWIEFPTLLGRPALEGTQPVSNLAEIMVMAMVAIELLEAVHDRRYAGVMRDSFDAALKHHDVERDILLETVDPEGTRRLSCPDGRFFNPGHSIETAWLLLRLLQHLPDKKRQRTVLEILEGSLEFGWDREFGGLFYFMDIEGRPMLQLEANMKLWWPHAEAIHAVILAYSLTGERKWLTWLERLDDYAFGRFPDAEHGEWYGYCDRRGNVTNTCKGSNFKGMYHLSRALLFSMQAIDRGTRPAADTRGTGAGGDR